MSVIYNLQRMKGAELVAGEIELWGPPSIATGHVIPLTNTGAHYERSRRSVLFTSNKEFEDFFDYFKGNGEYKFKNTTDQEMVFLYGSYMKTKTQKTQFEDPTSAVHAKSKSGGLRSASSAITGEGAMSEAARMALDGIGDSGHFGIGAVMGPLLKGIGVFRTRYYVLVTVKDKYGMHATVHGAKGAGKKFFNGPGSNAGSEGVTFTEIGIALKAFKDNGKKIFGYGPVELP